MIFYSALFFSFLYFKIARVHHKEELRNPFMIVQHLIVLGAFLALFGYGLLHFTWYIVLVSAFLFFIISALMVSAVQVGIFMDGKPVIKLSTLHKLMPLLGLLVAFSVVHFYVG